MNLAVFLAIGESWEDFKLKGQDSLFIEDKLRPYSKQFEQVYVFSYGDESGEIMPQVILLGNRHHIHRYLYVFLMPLLYFKEIKDCRIIRGMQLTGGLPGIIAKFLFKKKIVINYGYDYVAVAKSEEQTIRALLYKILEYVLVHVSDGVIVTTSANLHKINRISKHKTYLIPNSIDIDLFKPVKTRNRKTILFVGRLEQQKNLFMLIDAVSDLSDKNVKLMFIGGGSLKEDLLNYSRKKGVKLKIIDSVKHHILPLYYNNSTMFVLPSFVEGHPKALLEAMSCGLPVIGSKVPGIQELIEHNVNGSLITNTRDELARSIQKLLHNKILSQNLGKQARKTIIESFDRKKISIHEMQLMEKLVND